jgi:hypothetical protein
MRLGKMGWDGGKEEKKGKGEEGEREIINPWLPRPWLPTLWVTPPAKGVFCKSLIIN